MHDKTTHSPPRAPDPLTIVQYVITVLVEVLPDFMWYPMVLRVSSGKWHTLT